VVARLLQLPGTTIGRSLPTVRERLTRSACRFPSPFSRLAPGRERPGSTALGTAWAKAPVPSGVVAQDEPTPAAQVLVPSLPPHRATVASVDGTFPSMGATPGSNSSSPRRVIARGFTWVTTSQLLTAGGNLVLTPFVIHGLGIERYGLFVLTGTITGFLGSLNGGLASTANRYFPIYAGADDRVATTKLLVTFMVFVLGIGAVMSVADWFVSPFIVRALSMSPGLRPESLFLFRTLGVLLTFGLLHQLVQSVVLARQRFDRVIQAGLLCYTLWVAGLVLVIHYHEGLRGIAIVFVAQQVATTAVIAPTALRYLTRKGFALLPRAEVRRLMSFAARLQVAGIAGLINVQLDTLVIGTALSVRTVGIYNSGNSFAGQLSSVATNVVAPASVQLGNTYGKDGPERTFEQFNRMQRNWMAAVTGWSAVGMASAYFAVTAWLGPEFKLGGWVAVAAVAGGMAALAVEMVNAYVTVMRQPGIEMRYGLALMVANLVLVLPLALVGALAVAIGAALAQVLSVGYLMRMVRLRVHPDIPKLLRQVPLVKGFLAALITVLLELLVRPFIVIGPVGLLECVPPAAIGIGVFSLLVVGPGRATSFLAAAVRKRGLPPFASSSSSDQG
jgi:O-antigen/teichoic acid export membrane protein